MKNQFVCTVCGYVGEAKKVAPGNILIELVLWLLLIVPGIIFSIYRMVAKKSVCAKCGSPLIIPADSPKGQELLAKKA